MGATPWIEPVASLCQTPGVDLAASGAGLGLSFEVLWCDSDVPEVLVRAGNGRFSGECEIYATLEELVTLAGALRGFPAGASDQRFARLGTFEGHASGGGLRIAAVAADGDGWLDVELSRAGDAVSDSVRLRCRIDARGVDRFLGELDRLCAKIRGTGAADDLVGATASLPAAAG